MAPYSERSKYTHLEVQPPPKGIVRIRTVTEPDGTEARVGYDRANKAHLVSVLVPKGGSPPRGRKWVSHPHSRGEHGGPCDAACRRGMKAHPHRRQT